jgi:hypothetical protein
LPIKTVTVKQTAALDPTCVFYVTPLATSVQAAGGTVPIAVTTAATCLWNATSNAAWIVITGPLGDTTCPPAEIETVIGMLAAAHPDRPAST